MPDILFEVDLTKPWPEQRVPGHNRWHPDIPPVASVKPGAVFRIECQEWTDGQIRNDDSANDVRDVDLTRNHVLSGPIAVEGAEPGDLLIVDILDLGPFPNGTKTPHNSPTTEWGYTGIFAKVNGGGFLTDHYPDPHKAIWDLQGTTYAQSRHIPDVRYVGIPHPGLIGCAPSAELLAEWNRREAELISTNPNRVPPLALPPLETNAVLGTLKGPEFERAAKEAARTIPPREHGGNCDIKNLTRGSRCYFPVYVPGAKLSMGDLHFSQGDGEISGTGVEIAIEVQFTVRVLKHKAIGWPRGENADFIFAVGNARPLDQALQHATTEMARWLRDDYGLDTHETGILMGQTAKYDLGNFFDPAYTMVCKLPKRILPARA